MYSQASGIGNGPFLNDVIKVSPVDIFHHQEVHALIFIDIKSPDNMGMIE